MLTLYKCGKSRAWWMRLRLISGVDIRRSTGLEDCEKAELATLDMVTELLREGAPRKETVIPLKPLIDLYGEWAKMRHTPGTVCRELLALKTFSKHTGGNLSSTLKPEEFIKWRLKKVPASCVNVDLRHSISLPPGCAMARGNATFFSTTIRTLEQRTVELWNARKWEYKDASMTQRLSRRALFKNAAKGIAAVAVAGSGGCATFSKKEETALEIDPQPRFELSPWLYMQFMEPLGTTDGSVEAAWDHLRNCWREEVIEVSRDLAPTLMRWGGCLSSYYRWKEGVGPRDQRQPMLNLLWGGIESNQVGTVEFIDFCRQIGAAPLMCVNFESDGREKWMKDPHGRVRAAGPEEAAEWVAYCNDAGNPLRASHGHVEPCRIPVWQIGNETSYDRSGFDCETASRKTVEFARAMRKADPSIALIGWGDNGWAPHMIEVAGEDLQYMAFHHMYNPGSANDSPLKGTEYRKDPARTWDALMEAWKPHAAKIQEMREQTKGKGMPLALTECHFALRGPERCHVLSTWAAGVAMARLLNVHTRNGDVLKIATAADFCGNRWQVNAVMIPDRQPPYMMPVARVMQLYRAHTGQQALDPISVPDELDVTASRTNNRVFVHVVNTSRTRAVSARLSVAGMTIMAGHVFQIAADPEFEVWSETRDVIAPARKELPSRSQWTFPAASVSVVELEVTADPAATQ